VKCYRVWENADLLLTVAPTDNMRVSWLGGFVLFLVQRRAFGQHEYDEIHHFCDEHGASLRDIIMFDSGKYPSPDDTTYMAELYADKNKFVQAKTVMYDRNATDE
jgi:hypothetical protein